MLYSSCPLDTLPLFLFVAGVTPRRRVRRTRLFFLAMSLPNSCKRGESAKIAGFNRSSMYLLRFRQHGLPRYEPVHQLEVAQGKPQRRVDPSFDDTQQLAVIQFVHVAPRRSDAG